MLFTDKTLGIFELIGKDKTADDENATDVAHHSDAFVEDDSCYDHSHKWLTIEVVVGCHRAQSLHCLVPKQVGHNRTHSHQEQEIEHVLRVVEVPKKLEVVRF